MTTIFIAASGSGGHLFPAVYIAASLKKLNPSVRIFGIGSGRPLEEKIFSDWNIPSLVIPTVGIKNRGFKGILQFFFLLPKSIIHTIKLFYKYKPCAVIGAGGYATVFPVLMAWLLGLPTWIHEAEMNPGLANKFLSFFANRISTAFLGAKFSDRSRLIFTGHPVREGLLVAQKQAITDRPLKNILILGGSQGAKGLDQALPQLHSLIKQNNLNVMHQSRHDLVESVRNNYLQNNVNAEVVSFIDDMSKAYQWADIVISRSGAGTVMELGVVNIPSILVPFPFSQGDHQTINAMTLVDSGKALIVQERDSQFLDKLSQALVTLLDRSVYQKMVQLPKQNRSLSAADSIAANVLEMC